MGNSNSVTHSSHKNKLFHHNSKKSLESFFISHHTHQSQSISQSNLDDPDFQKRVVFISIMGLYESWKLCPSSVLYSSIFILPLKKQWILHPKKYESLHEFALCFKDLEFVKLLKWKDEQGLVFWMKDEITNRDIIDSQSTISPDFIDSDIIPSIIYGDNSYIAPFWRYLSLKLTNLYDPVTNCNYNPLILDEEWWINSNEKYSINSKLIIDELYHLKMKFKSIKEILYQSNSSLNILTRYRLNDNKIESSNSKSQSGAKYYIANASNQKSASVNMVDIPVAGSVSGCGSGLVPINDTKTKSSTIINSIINSNSVHNDNVWWVSEEYDDCNDVDDDCIDENNNIL